MIMKKNAVRAPIPPDEHLAIALIKPMIMKKNALRAPTPPDEHLAIALLARFLASGESQASLSYYFKIGKAITHVG